MQFASERMMQNAFLIEFAGIMLLSGGASLATAAFHMRKKLTV